MKITQQQTSSMIQQHTQPRIKLDFGAMCFFMLGMFLVGLLCHFLF
ncbi:hypothetical protein [Acinetobacter sp. MD2(2019)]|nr:hypothetical protein [Acinetobacter sp. MD2(2019)]MEB3753465.1 hypothetical protein [Acinetobacter sp. MD2(2019)]